MIYFRTESGTRLDGVQIGQLLQKSCLLFSPKSKSRPSCGSFGAPGLCLDGLPIQYPAFLNSLEGGDVLHLQSMPSNARSSCLVSYARGSAARPQIAWVPVYIASQKT